MLLRRLSISSTNTSRVRERHLKSTFKNLFFYGKYLLFVIIFVLFIFIISRFFVVKTINCHTNEGICSVEVEKLFNFLLDKNYFSIDQKRATDTIKNIFPVQSITYNFQLPGKLKINISGWESTYILQTYQLSNYPILSADQFSGSTDSATWRRPSLEISEYLVGKDSKTQKLWAIGRLTPDSPAESDIKELFVENPTDDMLSEFYQLIVLSKKYLEKPQIIIIGPRVLLSQPERPDIIINVPSDLGQVETALQSIEYLYTIKKDARVIDLSFKHPIIK